MSMDPNLHLALALATRDDIDQLLYDLDGVVARDALASTPLGAPDDAPRDLVWSDERPSPAFDALWDDSVDDEAWLIRDLDGIQPFTRLCTVDLACSQVTDLRPLVALGRLEALRLGVSADADLSPLLELRALQRLDLRGAGAETHQAVLRQLAERGVLLDRDLPALSEVSAPFADPNLKLAVIDHVRRDDLPASLPAFDEYVLDEANLTRVLALPITADDLAGIEELAWKEGGREVQHLVYPQWHGEADTFSIRTLAGIEHLPRLRQLACRTRHIPPAEIEALIARDVIVFDDPYVPRKAPAPHRLEPALLYALQFATHGSSHYPLNFWTWSPVRRKAYLGELAMGKSPVDYRKMVRWSLEPSTRDHRGACLPELVREPDEALDVLRIRDLRGIDVVRDIRVLDVPLSEVGDLAPLNGVRSLRQLRITVTADADLSVLTRFRQLERVEVLGPLREEQRAVLATLARGRVTVV